MHEKKTMKSYGGLAKKYEKELSAATLSSLYLAMMTDNVIKEMGLDDSDHGDIQSGWLNGPYQLMQQSEREVADLEAKIKNDPQFSEKAKQELMHDLIEPIKDGNRKAREIDAYIMNGTTPPSMK